MNIEELSELLKQPKPDDDIDLIDTVSQLMNEVGLDQDYIETFKRTTNANCGNLHSKIQRQHIAIFLVTDIGLIEIKKNKNAMGLRYMVLSDTDLEEWLKVLKDAVLPYIQSEGETYGQ